MLDDFPGILPAAPQFELFSWKAAFCPTVSDTPSLLFSEYICLEWELLRFGKPHCRILARLYVWEELGWTGVPLNEAAATASRVWSKESGWSWTAHMAFEVSETSLVGAKHPAILLIKTLSFCWLPSFCESQVRGFLTVNKNEHTWDICMTNTTVLKQQQNTQC